MTRNLLHRVDHWIHTLFRLLAMALVLALCVIMVLQVFQRFVMERSLDWPDELAPTLLAWIGFVGAALAARDNEHVSFPLLLERLPQIWSDLLRVVGNLVVVSLLFVYSWFSIPLIVRTWNQDLTTVPISRGLLYVILPLSCVLMIGYVLRASPLMRWLTGAPPPQVAVIDVELDKSPE